MVDQNKPNFRLLCADEIDCRVGTITENGLSLLLYKDARVDQNILDETVGPMNWQRAHSRENANCVVSIWDGEKGHWVSKEDTGTESNTEKEKGLASDSFKRACFNWGIGRELYTTPRIWISSENCKIEKGKSGRLACRDPFRVKEITYGEKRTIKSLVIVGKNSKVVFPKNCTGEKNTEEFEEDLEKVLVQETHINVLYAEMKRTGVGAKNLLAAYGLEHIGDMNMKQFRDAKESFKKKPDKPTTPDAATLPPNEEENGLPWNTLDR